MPTSKNGRREEPYERNESPASKSVTIVWSLSVVMALICTLMAAAARALIWAQPESNRLPVLEAFTLFSACLIGALSLVLVPVVYRIRRIPPPTGLVVFGVIVAAVPWFIVAVRSFQ